MQGHDTTNPARVMLLRRLRCFGRRVASARAFAWFGLAVSLLLTALACHHALSDGSARARAITVDELDRAEATIRTRMASYEQVLTGAAALFAGSDKVTRTEWATYVAGLRLGERLPGIQSVGFAPFVHQEEMAAHIAAVRKLGPADYEVRPAGRRQVSVPIQFNAPEVARTRAVIGFDMYSEQVRRAAMDKARETGRPVMSGRVLLAGEAAEAMPLPGFIVYAPVYRLRADGDEAFFGFVYAPFRAPILLRSILGEPREMFRLRVLDAEAPDGDQLYASPLSTTLSRVTASRSIEVLGHSWTIHVDGTKALDLAAESGRAMWSLIIGLVVSGLLFLLLTSMRQAIESARRFRDYAELGSDWLWEQDAAGRFTFLSAHLSNMIEGPVANVVGRTHRELFAALAAVEPEDAPVWQRLEGLIALRAPIAEFDVRVRDVLGTLRHLRLTGRPVLDENGRFRGYRGVGRETTRERAAEEELRRARDNAETADRAKSRFLANMSHELRTPLNAIIGFSDGLLSGAFGTMLPKQREYIGDVRAAGTHLLELISDVLDEAKIAVGAYAVEIETVDLAALLRECVTMISPRADAAGVGLGLTTPSVLLLRADRRATRQVLLNLMSNAVKFTARGGHVEVQAWREPDGSVGVCIIDDGIGIDSAALAKVFEPFYQVDPGQEGTGLGLSISRSLMAMHGGSLSLESRPKKGTRATVRFPAVTADAGTPGDRSVAA